MCIFVYFLSSPSLHFIISQKCSIIFLIVNFLLNLLAHYNKDFLSILWCSCSSDHPQDDLARFGCIPIYEHRNKLESFYILSYLLKLIIKFRWFGFVFSLKSSEYQPFFPWQILWIGGNHFFFNLRIWPNFA